MSESTPKQQVIGARVPYDQYRQFEQLCIEHHTNMSRAIGEYISLCLQAGEVLHSQYSVNDTRKAKPASGACGNYS